MSGSKEMIAVGARRLRRLLRRTRCRPRKDIDHVLTAHVDNYGYVAPIYVIEPSADQRKSERVQPRHIGRHVDATVEPRFDIVLIVRRDVGQMSGHERSDVARQNLLLSRIRRGSL